MVFIFSNDFAQNYFADFFRPGHFAAFLSWVSALKNS
jgi:hypothetical protein